VHVPANERRGEEEVRGVEMRRVERREEEWR
jgi:hypothetical protein